MMDGLTLTVKSCAIHLDMISLVCTHKYKSDMLVYLFHLPYVETMSSLSALLSTDKPLNHTIPQSLSKPVHLHNIVCSSRDLTLLECSFTKYSGNINDIQDVIINCQECI